MHKVAFLLACAACAGHGRRLGTLSGQFQSSSRANDQKPLEELAKLFILHAPAVSFVPAVGGASFPKAVDRPSVKAVLGSPHGSPARVAECYVPHQTGYRARLRADDLAALRCGQPRMAAAAERLIGISLLAGSAVKGLPQIIRIIRARSVSGLSLSAFYGDFLVFLAKVVYHVRRSYPISAWCELLLLLNQQIMCISLYHIFGQAGLTRKLFSKTSYSASRLVLFSSDVAVGLLLAFALFRLLPASMLPLLSVTTAPLIFCSYAAQILTNWNNKSTGELAPITVFMRWAFSLIRVGTTWTQLGGDPFVLINHALGALGCGILLGQIYHYDPARYVKDEDQSARSSMQYLSDRLAAIMWRSLGGFTNDEYWGGSLPSTETLKSVFDKIDTDGSGKVSREELLEAIKRNWRGKKPSQQAVETMLSNADQDGDGLINFDEFCLVIRKVEI
mmetsp:Transcript_28461/g.46577  ORF Transcript_28461/g.46577 Transcript_28461/m.46577 type:complete len:448 (+) Transcript_28461:46-1389(+)